MEECYRRVIANASSKKNIGYSLRIRRVELCMRQQDIAEKLGMSTTAYAKIERGETNLSVRRIKQLTEILQIDLSDMVFDDPTVLREEIRALTSELQKFRLMIEEGSLKYDKPEIKGV